MMDARPTPDPERKVMFELEQDAVLLLVDEDWARGITDREPPHKALGPLRLERGSPDWSTQKPRVLLPRIHIRRRYAEELQDSCDHLAEILEDFPEESDRQKCATLKRAATTFKNTLRTSVRE